MNSDAPETSYIARRVDVNDKPVPIKQPKMIEKKMIEKRIIFVELSETKQILLNITGHRTRSPIFLSNIDEANIIERKRARRPNFKYVNVS